MKQLQRHLDDVFTRPTLLGALKAGRRLRQAARQAADSGVAARLLLGRCGEDADALSRYLLVHALALAGMYRLEGEDLRDRAA